MNVNACPLLPVCLKPKCYHELKNFFLLQEIRNYGYSLVNGIIPLDASIYLFIVPNGSVLIIFPSSRLDH